MWGQRQDPAPLWTSVSPSAQWKAWAGGPRGGAEGHTSRSPLLGCMWTIWSTCETLQHFPGRVVNLAPRICGPSACLLTKALQGSYSVQAPLGAPCCLHSSPQDVRGNIQGFAQGHTALEMPSHWGYSVWPFSIPQCPHPDWQSHGACSPLTPVPSPGPGMDKMLGGSLLNKRTFCICPQSSVQGPLDRTAAIKPGDGLSMCI